MRLAITDPSLTVHAQSVPIRQVMVNLLRNSIDATRRGTRLPIRKCLVGKLWSRPLESPRM